MNEMKQLYIALFLLMSALVTSCGDRETERLLDDVDSYIREFPDSALKVLRDVDPRNLNTNRLRAQYSLLHAMALDKNYIDTTDISVVMPAVDYYKRHGNADEKLRAYFYLGRIYQNDGKLDKAAVAYSLAEEAAEDANDEVQKGLLYMNFSFIYNKVHNTNKELEYARKGLASYQEVNDTSHINLAYGDLALAYHSKLDWRKADSLYSLGIEKAKYDTLVEINLLSNYAKMKMIQSEPDPQGAIDLLDRMYRDYHQPLSIMDYGVYAYALELIGSKDACDQILCQLENLDSRHKEGALNWLYRIYMNRSDYKNALDYVLATIKQNNNDIDSLLAVPVSEGLKNHFMSVAYENRARSQRIAMISVSFITVMILLFIILYLRQRLLRMKERESENRMSLLLKESNDVLERENQELKSKNSEYEEERVKLRKSFATIYKDRFATIGELCKAFFDSKGRKDQKDIIYYRVERLIAGVSDDSKLHAKFEAQINRELDGIITHLKNDIGELNKLDERFICYIIAGFDTQTISSILDLSVPNIYTKKSRLRERIKKMDSPYKDDYLQMI